MPLVFRSNRLHTLGEKTVKSEETITKFQSQLEIEEVACDFSVLYEDDNVLIVNKPIGVLSQKAKKEDISLVEMIS